MKIIQDSASAIKKVKWQKGVDITLPRAVTAAHDSQYYETSRPISGFLFLNDLVI